MSKIKVQIKEKTVLVLLEDAQKGDIIDLKEIQEVDLTTIENVLMEKTESIYQKRMDEAKILMEAEYSNKILEINTNNEKEKNKLINKISELEKNKELLIKDHKNEIEKLELTKNQEKKIVVNEKDNIYTELKAKYDTLLKIQENDLKIKEAEIENKYKNKINELEKNRELLIKDHKNEIEKIELTKTQEKEKAVNEKENMYNQLKVEYDNLLKTQENDMKLKEVEIENKYKNKINELEKNKELLVKDHEIKIDKLKSEYEFDKLKAMNEQKDDFQNKLAKKDEEITLLKRQKSNLNVKETGEDLESWCNNEVSSYMQNGLFNCEWLKDNKAIKNDGETAGTKADYIFKVYASDKHNDDELLAAVCLEMKDENPDSKNKKTNADHYKQLDINRQKKKCTYSVLVSNLELDKSNILPIYKVREYENMYVVRPGYLMTFLNMITSLTTKFSSLLLSEKLELKDAQEIINAFEDIKKTYLDKPLESLEREINKIETSTQSIKTAASNIETSIESIKNSYISKIESKLSKFEIKNQKNVLKKL